ncbi:MAG: metallophosphoesterase [Alphaproteobacteria bacterium]|nr:metallophosphoesterase [Alphaproteobacteria bacterium]
MPTRRPLLPLLVSVCLAVPAIAAAHKHTHAHPVSDAVVTVETLAATSLAEDGTLRASWVQYAPHGELEIRAVVDGSVCPAVYFDLREGSMQRRAAADAQFKVLCTALIPAGTQQAALAFPIFHTRPPEIGASPQAWQAWGLSEYGVAMPGPEAGHEAWLDWAAAVQDKRKFHVVPVPLPVSDPRRILVLGDTGCRIKGKELQDCSDPAKWPFPQIAAEAARLRPDLVIHVGDYLYRENACPPAFAGCTGTPWGDNWPTWDADFFTPAKPLLAAAPWVIVRGNHEDCRRSGSGWLRLLGPLPYDPGAPCIPHLTPYSVPLAGLNLVVMDDADAPEMDVVPDLVPVYRDEFATLANQPSPTWLLMHRPIWGAISGPLGVPVGGNKTLAAAVSDGIPSPVTLLVSGHIHTFEAINYRSSDHVPPQLIAGFGGDLLDETPENLKGAIFQGDSHVGVTDGLSIGGFGFLLMTRTDQGWTIDVHDVHGRIERQCSFAAGRLDCPGKN